MKNFFKFNSFVIVLLAIAAIAFPLTACGNDKESNPEKSSTQTVTNQTHNGQEPDSADTKNQEVDNGNQDENKSVKNSGQNRKSKIERKDNKSAATPPSENFETQADDSATTEYSYLWCIFAAALIIFAIAIVVLFFYYKICVSLDTLEQHLKTSISNLLRKQSNFGYNRDNGSQTADLISQSERKFIMPYNI